MVKEASRLISILNKVYKYLCSRNSDQWTLQEKCRGVLPAWRCTSDGSEGHVSALSTLRRSMLVRHQGRDGILPSKRPGMG